MWVSKKSRNMIYIEVLISWKKFIIQLWKAKRRNDERTLFKESIYYRTNEFKPDRLTLYSVMEFRVLLPRGSLQEIFENKYNVWYTIFADMVCRKFLRLCRLWNKKLRNDLHELVSYPRYFKIVLISNSFDRSCAWIYKLWRDTVIAKYFTSPECTSMSGFWQKLSGLCLKYSLEFGPFTFNPRPRVMWIIVTFKFDWLGPSKEIWLTWEIRDFMRHFNNTWKTSFIFLNHKDYSLD